MLILNFDLYIFDNNSILQIQVGYDMLPKVFNMSSSYWIVYF